MISSLITTVLSVAILAAPEAQADVVLNYLLEPDPSLIDASVALDNSNHLWLIGHWGVPSKLHASRINPKGVVVLDKIPLYTAEPFHHLRLRYRNVLCDSRNNAYFTFGAVHFEMGNSKLRLMQVTPEGSFQEHNTWPNMVYYNHYLELLPGDTLLLAGEEEWGKPARIVKAALALKEITPVYDATHSMASYINKTQFLGDYAQVIINWKEGSGIRVDILHERTDNPQYGPDNLRIKRLSGGPEEKSKPLKVNVYPWRDYVWRSYSNCWIGWLTFSDYKDGGYLLYIPDPLDRSTTYVLRLDEEGTPIDPSTLKGKGKSSARSFDRLPESAESQADFRWWKDNNSRRDCPDSAHVIFWGCDNEGNLYVYRKFRTY